MAAVKISALTDPVETWNDRYAQSAYIFGTEPNHYLVQCQRYLKAGMSALAIADGEGRNSVWLAKQGLTASAFDISTVAVEKARRLARDENVEVDFSVADCGTWDWDSSKFDVVVAIFVQFAAPNDRKLLFANMIRSLKPGGLIILQGYTPKQLEYKTGGPPDLDNLYTEDLLRDEFSGLDIIDMNGYEMELREGSQHSGMSALIGMVAKK